MAVIPDCFAPAPRGGAETFQRADVCWVEGAAAEKEVFEDEEQEEDEDDADDDDADDADEGVCRLPMLAVFAATAPAEDLIGYLGLFKSCALAESVRCPSSSSSSSSSDDKCKAFFALLSSSSVLTSDSPVSAGACT